MLRRSVEVAANCGRSAYRVVEAGVLAARSRILWGDRVHGFYQVVGVVLIFVCWLVAVLG